MYVMEKYIRSKQNINWMSKWKITKHTDWSFRYFEQIPWDTVGLIIYFDKSYNHTFENDPNKIQDNPIKLRNKLEIILNCRLL